MRRPSSPSPRNELKSGVSVGPGHTTLTLMRAPASSRASVLEKAMIPPRPVDEDVGGGDRFFEFRHRRLDRAVIGDVYGDRARPSARGLDRLGRLRGSGGVFVEHAHGAAFLAQAQADGAPDGAAA